MHFSLDQVNSLKDLQTTFNWLISFTSPAAANLPSEDLHIRCQTATLPVRDVQFQEFELHGQQMKRPGKVTTSGEITLNFVEDLDLVVTTSFMNLLDKMWAVESTQGSKGTREDYANLNFTVTMMLLDHKEQPTQTYTLKYCLLKGFTPGGDLNTDNDFMKPSATISYQDFLWSKN